MSLVNYSGSSSEEEDASERTEREGRKRKFDESSDATDVSSATRGTVEKQIKKSLPLPSAIQQMFDEGKKEHRDKPEEHGGRVRSFPHMEGNWASYVYIPVSPDERLQTFMNELLLCLRPLNFQLSADHHISLSRTVCIRHHWIEPLTQSLKEEFQKLDSCLCDVQSVKLYTNDEKTRTFLSLEVSSEDTNLHQYSAAVDTCFKEFNLPGYYKNPSYHISVLWCVGDVMAQIPDTTRHKLQVMTEEFLNKNPDLSVIPADRVSLRTGNKTFSFSLRTTDMYT